VTASLTLFQRADRLRVAAFLFCLALLLSTASLLALPATNSNRFLFLIDTSAGMKPFEKGAQDSLFDSISSGLRGRMTNNDTYGIWLLNEEVDTSFKMELWRDKFKVEQAAKAAVHLKEHGYRGRLNLDQAMNDVLAIVRAVGDVTLIFISNGETPLVSTPFDSDIKARFQELAPAMKRKKLTVNTVLAAQDGKLVAWAVNAPDVLMKIPVVPPKPKPATPVIVARTPPPLVTNAAPVVVAPEAPPPARPRPASGPIIITKDIVALERRQFLALASTYTNEAGATPAGTNPVPAPAAESINEAPANTNFLTAATNPATAPVIVSLPTSNVAVKPPALATTPSGKAPQTATNSSTNQPAPAAVATLAKPAATDAAPMTVSASMPPATPAMDSSVPTHSNPSPTTEAHSESSRLFWVAIGAAAMLVCMLSVMMVLRVRRPEPSLVSQAIIRERMRTS